MKLYIAVPVLVFVFAIGGCQSKQITDTQKTDFGGDQPSIEQSDTMHDEQMEDNTNNSASDTMTGKAVIKKPAASVTPVVPKEFSVKLEAGKFDPATINVTVGDTVLLHVTSVGEDMGIGIDGYGINRFVAENNTVDVQFVANKPGAFAYFCDANCDPETAVNGQLVVSTK